MDYTKLVNNLGEREDDCFQLTYSQIEEILEMQLPRFLTEYGGITQKSELGKAILSAGFLLKTVISKKQQTKLIYETHLD